MLYAANCDFPFPSKQTSVALGIFDGVHLGHRAVLKAAVDQKPLGLMPSVFTFTTKSIKPRAKELAPTILSQQTKRSILAELDMELVLSPDFTEIKDYTAEAFIKEILKDKMNAKILCCGENFKLGKNACVDAVELRDIAAGYDMETIILPPVGYKGEMISSSRIRKALEHGEMNDVNAMLGRRYSIDFVVSKGNRLGHQLGFPTINQEFPENFVVPRYGVYYSEVLLGTTRYRAITNIGVKPTVMAMTPLAETHLLEFDGDLYGERVLVSLLQFVRPEREFSSVEDLKQAIRRDIDDLKKR